MRYIKHFEELEWSTYSSAASELRKESPKKNKERVDELENYADQILLKKRRAELEGLVVPVTIKITDNKRSIPSEVGMFYAYPYPEYEIFEESIEDGSVKEIPFKLVITPVDKYSEEVCRKTMPEGEDIAMYGIAAMWLSLELKLEKGTHELGRLKVQSMDPYVYGDCELQGRPAYGSVKRTLEKMFTDKSGEFYEEFEQRIIAGHGLSSDHGLSMEKIANHLKSLSVNRQFMAD